MQTNINNDILDPIIEGFDTIGAPESKEKIHMGDISQDNIHQNTTLVVSSRNAYNASLSFLKTNVSTHIGFSKNIRFGDSYSRRKGETFLSIVSSDIANFTIGNSEPTTEAEIKRSQQRGGKYSIQKGENNSSYTEAGIIADMTLSTEGLYYKTYSSNRVAISVYGGYLSLNTGLVDSTIRGMRYSTYLINFNTNHYLASSRVFHLFLSIVANNKWGTKAIAYLIGKDCGMDLIFKKLYSQEYNMFKSTNLLLDSGTSAVGIAKIILDADMAKILKANHRMIMP